MCGESALSLSKAPILQNLCSPLCDPYSSPHFTFFIIHDISAMSPLALGDIVPDFTGETTKGRISLHSFISDSWLLLFSHTAAFSPVCTSEMAEMAKYAPEFQKRGAKLLAISTDQVDSYKLWIEDVQAYSTGCSVSYPVMADPEREIMTQLNMVDPEEKDAEGRPRASRALHIIGPDKRLKLSFLYPGSTGRNMEEVIRVLDSLQLAAKYKNKIATPANWKPGESVSIATSVSDEEAKLIWPVGFDTVNLPSAQRYLRFTQASMADKGNFTEESLKFLNEAPYMNYPSKDYQSLFGQANGHNASSSNKNLTDFMRKEQERGQQKEINNLEFQQIDDSSEEYNDLSDDDEKDKSANEVFGKGDSDLEVLSLIDFTEGAKDNRADLWPANTIMVLIRKFEEAYVQRNCGRFKPKQWEQIANEVNIMCKTKFSWEQVKYKWNRLKQHFKKEKRLQSVAGSRPSSWPFFKEMERVVSKTPKFVGLNTGFTGTAWKDENNASLKRKELEPEMAEEQASEELDHQNDPGKIAGAEGKSAKKSKVAMDSVAETMKENMKQFSETMKEIEYKRMEHEGMRMEKMLQMQFQIAKLFSQK